MIFFFLASLYLISNTSLANDFEIVGGEFIYFPKSQTSSGDSIELNEFNILYNFPAPQSDPFHHQISFGRLGISIEDEERNKIISGPVHQFGYTLDWVKPLSSEWSSHLAVSPQLVSDMGDSISKDDAILQGFYTFEYTFSKKLIAGLGIAHLTSYGHPQFFPAIIAEYKSSSTNLFIKLPISIDLNWKINDKLILGFLIEDDGNQYNVNQKIPGSEVTLDKLHYARINSGPYFEWHQWKRTTLIGSAGITTNRIFKYDTEEAGSISYPAKSGPFIQLGLSFSTEQE